MIYFPLKLLNSINNLNKKTQFIVDKINYFKIDGRLAIFHPSIKMPSHYSFVNRNNDTLIEMKSGEEAIVLHATSDNKRRIRITIKDNNLEIVQHPSRDKLALSNIDELEF